jgi:hypothetical protein
MCQLSRAGLCLLAVGFLAALGCRGSVLNDERTVSVEPGAVKAVIIDGPVKDQKVTVAVNSPGAPVTVCVVLEKDRKAAEEALTQGKVPAGVLASKEKAEEATVETMVSAKNEFAVVLNNVSGKAAQVKLKITGR